jgi:arylsulfatase A-like enzyme
MGPRGDVILEFDWSVGQIMNAIDSLKLSDRTIIIVTSDNGPVVDDGYKDQAVEKLDGHTPAGPLRGGKYSLFDGGTRVVFMVKWNRHVIPGVSTALFSQVDLMSSFAALTGQTLSHDDGPDSFNQIDAILGKTAKGRDWLVEHSGRLSIIKGDWKFIEPGPGPKLQVNTDTETGNNPFPQLYNMNSDIGEKNNVARYNPDLVKELTELLRKIKDDGRTRF